jgi:hypothetical protein
LKHIIVIPENYYNYFFCLILNDHITLQTKMLLHKINIFDFSISAAHLYLPLLIVFFSWAVWPVKCKHVAVVRHSSCKSWVSCLFVATSAAGKKERQQNTKALFSKCWPIAGWHHKTITKNIIFGTFSFESRQPLCLLLTLAPCNYHHHTIEQKGGGGSSTLSQNQFRNICFSITETFFLSYLPWHLGQSGRGEKE